MISSRACGRTGPRALAIFACIALAAAVVETRAKEHWDIADNIRMMRIARVAADDGAQFVYSPDRTFVAFVVEAPNLQSDEVDTTLRVYRTSTLQSFLRIGGLHRPLLELSVG